MKIVGSITIALLGIMLGSVLGFGAIYTYVANSTVKVDSVAWCGLDNNHACEVLQANKVWMSTEMISNLPTSDNYNEQKTAPVHVLEPKVSDAAYQYGEGKVLRESRLAVPYTVNTVQVVKTVPVGVIR